jgi:hypothetical protein
MAGLLSIAPSAIASIGATDGVCAFTGRANVNASAVQYVSGGGSFGFTGTAVCAGQGGGAPQVVGPTSLTANGNYGSLVCGTSQPLSGNAAGTAQLGPSGSFGTGNFSIPFVGGQGVITGNFAATSSFGGGSGPIAGAVTIFPNNPATALVVGGSSNHPDNPTPVDFSTTPAHPVTGAIFTGPNGDKANGTQCVDVYGVAGAFAILG